jgi:hypothetical protein
MLADGAAGGCAQQSVMARNVACDTADSGALGTPLGVRGAGDGHECRRECEDEKMSFHGDSLWVDPMRKI